MKERNALIVVNPASGKSSYQDKLTYLRSRLLEESVHSYLYFTEQNSKGGLKVYLSEHPEIDEIIVMGGDGTLNYVVNETHPCEYTLAIVSNGTGNDSVKSLHKVLDFKEQVEIAIYGETALFDLGICNTRYFINGVGIGFDGEVVRNMTMRGSKKGSHLDYLFTVLRILGGFSEKRLDFSVDGLKYDREILLFTVSNGTTFGGGFVLNPFAKSNDGFLDICLITRISAWRRFWNLPKLKSGDHFRLKEAEFYVASSILVEASHDVVAHIDGEYLGHPPFKFSLQKGALKLRVP